MTTVRDETVVAAAADAVCKAMQELSAAEHEVALYAREDQATRHWDAACQRRRAARRALAQAESTYDRARRGEVAK